jgi:hypothetical protein
MIINGASCSFSLEAMRQYAALILHASITILCSWGSNLRFGLFLLKVSFRGDFRREFNGSSSLKDFPLNQSCKFEERLKMAAWRVATFFIGTALASVSFLAAAHTEEFFDSRQSPHGGQMRMTGPYHLELVVKDNEIGVYVMDHADKEISVNGGSGKATIQNGKTKTKISVKLEQAGGNLLQGNGNFSITPETVIAVFVELPEQQAYAASFTPFKPKAKLANKTRDTKHHSDSGEEHSHHMHH